MAVHEGSAPDMLAANAIGLPQILFQAITFMAPAAGVALALLPGATFAGGALPLAVLLALVGCLLVGNSVAQMSRHMPSAGGLYTYAARALHPSVGFLVAWFFGFAYFLGVPIMCVIFGNVVASVLTADLGWSFNVLWPIATIVAATTILLLNYFGVSLSTKAGMVLGSFEILTFVTLTFFLIAHAGASNTASVFTFKFATAKGFTGFSGVAAASIFAIFAFIGFESAAPLGEETKNPRRNVFLAVLFSALSIGLFYTFTAYGSTVFFGPGHMTGFATVENGNPWDHLARSVWGVGWIVAFLALANSCMASANGVITAGSRMWYAMGRIRILPHALGRTHPKYRSPYISLVAGYVLTLVVALTMGAKYTPFVAFSVLGTIYTAIIIGVYIVTNLACVVYFAKYQRAEFNWLLHGLIPAVGIIVFIPAFFTAIGIGHQVLSFISPLPYPLNITGPVVLVLAIAGLGYLAYLIWRHPERIRETATLFSEPRKSVEEHVA